MKHKTGVLVTGFVVLTAWSLAFAGEKPDSARKTIRLVVGEQKAMRVPGIHKVSVQFPEIADIKAFSDDSFLVLGTSVGKTFMTVFTKGKPAAFFNIIVRDGLKRVTVPVRYADGDALARLLVPYMTENGVVRFEAHNRALSIADKPDVVDVMLKMIKRFDVKPPQLQLSLRLILATTGEKPTPVPVGLKSVAKELKEVFNYNRFTVLDKAFIRTEANQLSTLKLGGDRDYTAEIHTELVEESRGSVRLRFKMYRGKDRTLISTTVEIKDGETAILGASRINGEGKALITIVSMKLL